MMMTRKSGRVDRSGRGRSSGTTTSHLLAEHRLVGRWHLLADHQRHHAHEEVAARAGDGRRNTPVPVEDRVARGLANLVLDLLAEPSRIIGVHTEARGRLVGLLDPAAVPCQLVQDHQESRQIGGGQASLQAGDFDIGVGYWLAEH
jgi:hypothetical protein